MTRETRGTTKKWTSKNWKERPSRKSKNRPRARRHWIPFRLVPFLPPSACLAGESLPKPAYQISGQTRKPQDSKFGSDRVSSADDTNVSPNTAGRHGSRLHHSARYSWLIIFQNQNGLINYEWNLRLPLTICCVFGHDLNYVNDKLF